MEFNINYNDLLAYIKAYFKYLESLPTAEAEDSTFSEDYANLLKIKSRIGNEEANKIEKDIDEFIAENSDGPEMNNRALKKAYLVKIRNSFKGRRKGLNH